MKKRSLRADERGSTVLAAVVFVMIAALVTTSASSQLIASAGARYSASQAATSHSLVAHEALITRAQLVADDDESPSLSEGLVRSGAMTYAWDENEVSQTHHYAQRNATHWAGFDPAGEPLWVDRGSTTYHRFIKIASGPNHTIGLEDGTLYAWGQNDRGQLGVGDYQDRFEPTAVEVLEDGAPVSFTDVIVPTSGLSCAVAENRGLWCFGENRWNQMAQSGFTPSGHNTHPAPVRVDAGHRVASIQAEDAVVITSNTLCFIDAASILRCAGENAGATTGESWSWFAPLNAQRVAQVVGDSQTILARTTAGQVYAWTLSGLGAAGRTPPRVQAAPAAVTTSASSAVITPAGQLADGTGYPRPVRVNHPDGGVWSDLELANTDTEIYASTAYATDTNNNLYAWGDNRYGQAGAPIASGSGTYENMVFTPNRVASSVTQVVSTASAAAFLSGNRVHTLGRATEGQLGDGSQTHRHSPRPISLTGPGTLTAATGAGEAFCFLVGEDLKCWGSDFHTRTSTNSPKLARTPVQIGRYAHVTIGETFACAIDQYAYTFCWGRGELGELGSSSPAGTFTLAPEPVASRSYDTPSFTGYEKTKEIR
ncbi:hypothetical protein [Nesterenkonia rhizosphaerae]|uniref:Alpha-tubulin suppressor-like RCC1 family protein n=1 Tax=Nesterenkonia rhizosphaerae TaxID=1348272 RepID=A0ABP9FZW1_9MICC